MDDTYKSYMDDFGNYKKYTFRAFCGCGCEKHCGHSCLSEDCDCTECDCRSCSTGQGYN